MTRKHFEALAALLKEQQAIAVQNGTQGTVSEITYQIADMLAMFNPSFKRELFLKAAGVPE